METCKYLLTRLNVAIILELPERKAKSKFNSNIEELCKMSNGIVELLDQDTFNGDEQDGEIREDVRMLLQDGDVYYEYRFGSE